MLSPMPLADERSFGADDPVARYWLHNCVGFRVRGHGVVDEVTHGENGADVLAVRRLGVTTRVPTERVESVDPWTETIVLRSRRPARPPREGPHVAVTAGRAVAIFTALVLRRVFALVARLLLALAALTREHWPGARDRAGRIAATLAAVGQAYAVEARRSYRRQVEATRAWREERRRGEWGDEAPLTRAGDDSVGARRTRKRALVRASAREKAHEQHDQRDHEQQPEQVRHEDAAADREQDEQDDQDQ